MSNPNSSTPVFFASTNEDHAPRANFKDIDPLAFIPGKTNYETRYK